MLMSLRLLAIGAALAFAGAAVASPQSSMSGPAAKPVSSQQQRMTDCNKQASGMKGDPRKTFMSGCLKGQPAAAASPMAPMGKMTQQQKMTSCNADAKTKALSGADRKTFMSSCLKGAPAHP
jgi:hypothetical protein